jgi:hypothetical protein
MCVYERVHWYIVVFDGNKAQYIYYFSLLSRLMACAVSEHYIDVILIFSDLFICLKMYCLKLLYEDACYLLDKTIYTLHLRRPEVLYFSLLSAVKGLRCLSFGFTYGASFQLHSLKKETQPEIKILRLS